MLHDAVLFFAVAIIAAIFGFGGIAGTAAWVAQSLFIAVLILVAPGFLKRPAR